MKHVKLAVEADGIAVLTLDNADERVNLVSPAWIEEFSAAVERVATDPAITGAIVTSAKPGFMAGADLKFLVQFFDRGLGARDAYAFREAPSRMHRRIETCGKPFVAAINGAALGGGFELALACHRRIIVDDPRAVVGLPEVNVGLLPGSGGTQRLPRLIGTDKALGLLLDGRSLKPQEALALGVVDEVVRAADLLDAARRWLASRPDPVRAWDRKGWRMPDDQGLLSQKTAGLFLEHTARVSARTNHNYPAPIAIVAAVFEGLQLGFDGGLKIEGKYFAKLLADPVARNIIRTTFVNKGAAERLVRRPDGVPKFAVRRLGVIGAGMMGAGIAHAAAIAGIDVVLMDSTAELAETGRARIAKLLSTEVERGRRAEAAATTALERVTATADYAALAGCDLVVEAVFEDAAIKAGVTAKAEATMPPGAIFASNTSTLPISTLAEAHSKPETFIGLHFFSPVDRMALVEVIVGRRTSRETLAKSLDFVAQLRKTPIVVNDSRGFYTSRVFQTFIHEGMALLQEGVAPALIENAARHAGMPVGPLAVTDEVTIDLPMAIIRQAEAQMGDAYVRPVSFEVMRRMLEELKRPGRKGGGGFYEYLEGGKKRLWPGLADAFPPAATQPDVDMVKKRILYIQALETARCLEEGVITHAADGDLGSVLAWSFPAYTGGTLSLIDTVGIGSFVADCDRLADACGERFRPSPWLRERAAAGRAFHG